MFDTASHSRNSASIVPFEQIEETRRAFPASRLSFELLIEAPELLDGLALCASVFSRAGLELQSLRCGAQGRICCRLQDRDGADLGALVRELSGSRARIESWTTVVGAT